MFKCTLTDFYFPQNTWAQISSCAGKQWSELLPRISGRSVWVNGVHGLRQTGDLFRVYYPMSPGIGSSILHDPEGEPTVVNRRCTEILYFKSLLVSDTSAETQYAALKNPSRIHNEGQRHMENRNFKPDKQWQCTYFTVVTSKAFDKSSSCTDPPFFPVPSGSCTQSLSTWSTNTPF